MDNFGREQRKRDQALYITVIDAFSLGDLSDGSCSARGQLFEPLMAARDCLEQGWVRARGMRCFAFDDQPDFDSAISRVVLEKVEKIDVGFEKNAKKNPGFLDETFLFQFLESKSFGS